MLLVLCMAFCSAAEGRFDDLSSQDRLCLLQFIHLNTTKIVSQPSFIATIDGQKVRFFSAQLNQADAAKKLESLGIKVSSNESPLEAVIRHASNLSNDNLKNRFGIRFSKFIETFKKSGKTTLQWIGALAKSPIKLELYLRKKIEGPYQFIFAMLLLNFTFVGTKVRGVSMQPSVQNGDYFIAEKISSLLKTTPQIGEILVFSIGDRNLIKRVIGTEGDLIEFMEGRVYRNGELLVEDYLPEGTLTNSSGYQRIIVPKNHVYVLGDNRKVSRDSRELGPININQIVGYPILWL